MEVPLLVAILFEVLILLKETSAYDTCIINGRSRYCDNGCCSAGDLNYCCLTTLAIVGIVFGCIGAVCSITSVVCCIMQHKKRNGQVLSHPTRVMVVSSHNSSNSPPDNYPSTKPLPPGYSSYYHPNYQSGLPPYGAPPPYSNSSPASNPFKEAARAEISSSNIEKP